MLKKILVLAVTIFLTSNTIADDGVCKFMGSLAKMSAEKRDKGISQDTLLKELVREGKLDPKDSAAPFVINTVIWVYEENIPATSAYKKMYEKCNKALAKQR